MRNLILGCFSIFCAVGISFASGAVNAAPWKVDKSHSFILFEVTHLGLIPYPGRFKQFTVNLDYYPANVEASKVEVRIPVKTVETDDGLTNEALVSEQFFDANNFPAMTFVSTGVRRTGETTGIIDGDLTIIGNTRKVSMDAKFNGKAKHPFTGNPVIGVTAVAKINRMKWGLTAWRPFVGKTITIRIAFEASPE
jgi:polyisoprenoid-binding protein YceI